MKNELMEMLAYKRPADSRTETMFISKYLDTVPGMKKDKAGNRIVKIGKNPDTMFSCHTDTVHSEAGFTMPECDKGIVSANGEILGADDCAGVWLMREMIFAKRPGLYIFHRGEEIGGIGSRWIARHSPGLLTGIKCAIALDRMGQTDIITHMGERTCSDTFANSLASEIGINSLKPCSGGVFTDTLNYVGIVPECSNISVGYVRAHSKHETLDVAYLESLLEGLLTLKTGKLDAPGFTPDYDFSESWGDGRYYEPDHDLTEFIMRNPEKIARLLMDYDLTDEAYTY